MKIIKKMFIAVALCAAALFQVGVFAKQGTRSSLSDMQPTKALVDADVEEVANAEADKIDEMTQETRDLIDGANEVIRLTQVKLDRGEISRARAAAMIGEQKYTIEQANKQFAQVVGDAAEKVKEVEAQAGYSLSGLVSGIKSWYRPEERQLVAQAVLTELENEFKKSSEEYARRLLAANADPVASARYRDEWNAIKQEFENEILRQNLIIYNRASRRFWTTVAGAGALIGGALAYKYLNQPAKSWEMRSANATDQRWLDRAMRRQEELEQEQVTATKPSRLEQMKANVQNAMYTANESLKPYTKPSPETAKRYEKTEESFRRPAEAGAKRREELAEQRRARHQPPVAKPVVITLKSARQDYDRAKKRADDAEVKLQEAQNAFNDNEAEIERLRSAGATGKNAVKIRDLQRRQEDRLSKALINAETTFGSAQNSLTSAKRKLASVSE